MKYELIRRGEVIQEGYTIETPDGEFHTKLHTFQEDVEIRTGDTLVLKTPHLHRSTRLHPDTARGWTGPGPQITAGTPQ